MHNCIGDGTANHDDDHYGNYDSMLTDPYVGLYSYRDVAGPHINFTIKDGVLIECEGQNKHRPAKKYESTISQVVKKLRCRIDRFLASTTRLIWHNGGYKKLFSFPHGIQITGDLPYRHIVRSFVTPKNLTVKGTLSFEECTNYVTLSEGLTAKHVRIHRCKKQFSLGSNMCCDVLEIDFLPRYVPNGAQWGEVFYTPPKIYVPQRLSGHAFACLIQGKRCVVG